MSDSDASIAIRWIETVADELGDLCDHVVFLGGATVGLLVTDPGAEAARPTKDVDVIVEPGGWASYVGIVERLRSLGFEEDASRGAPLCRWIVNGIKVDVMPTDGDILGFTNRWYKHAMRDSTPYELPSGRDIQLISAPHFIATKLEAFRDRGEGDFIGSHDLEDVVAVVDGRATAVDEILRGPEPSRIFLREVCGVLLDDERFVEALPGFLPGDAASQSRLPTIIRRFERIAGRSPK